MVGAQESACRFRHRTQAPPHIPPLPDSLHYLLASLLRCRFPWRVKPFLLCCAYLIRLFSSQPRASVLPTISSANFFEAPQCLGWRYKEEEGGISALKSGTGWWGSKSQSQHSVTSVGALDTEKEEPAQLKGDGKGQDLVDLIPELGLEGQIGVCLYELGEEDFPRQGGPKSSA